VDVAAMSSAGPVLPLLLITGFLGAGKTTLLNRLVRSAGGERLAVLVNEFGEINVDADLIASADASGVVRLTNGCVCCSVQGDLVAAIAALLDRRDAGAIEFDRVVLETTGLADPGPILRAAAREPALRARLRRAGVVTLVDARHADRQLTQHHEAQRQIGLADLVLLNKTDLVEVDARARLARRLRAINGIAPIHETVQAEFDVAGLLETADGSGRHATPDIVSDCDHDGHEHHHHLDHVSTLSVRSDAAIDLDAFQADLSFLVMRYAERLLRFKGIIAMRGREERFVLQGVHDLVELRPDRRWRPDEPRRTGLVFIGFDLPRREIQALAASAR
jgi:G3E family GTPase